MARVVFVGVLSETRNGVDRETLERLELIGFEVKKSVKRNGCGKLPSKTLSVNSNQS